MTANIAEIVYDALIIPTGETTFGDQSFPVTNKAIELFQSGKYGCMFITGGYSGFATKERLEEKTEEGYRKSEGRETYDYILKKGIKGLDEKSVFYDDQSLESVGNLTYLIVEPMVNPYTRERNPNPEDFDNMQVIGQEGHLWRLRDYARIVMPGNFLGGEIDFYPVRGKHNDGLAAKVYHRGLMNAMSHYLYANRGNDISRPEKIHDFLDNKHPFYRAGWFDKPVSERKAIMAAVGGLWNLGIGAK